MIARVKAVLLAGVAALEEWFLLLLVVLAVHLHAPDFSNLLDDAADEEPR